MWSRSSHWFASSVPRTHSFQTEVKVDSLWSDDIEVTKVVSGENVKVKLKGVDENDISPGFVLCDPNNPIKSCKVFDAQVCLLLV